MHAHAHDHADTHTYIQTDQWEEGVNGQINQIIAETHLNSLFSGLDMVLPTPCQNKTCVWGERASVKETIYHHYIQHIYLYFGAYLDQG